jgi:malectin (di-glucose binding ER protein)/beta-propeller uncharacterized protein DUF5122
MHPLKKIVASLVGVLVLGLPVVAQAPTALAAVTDTIHPGLVSKSGALWSPRAQKGQTNAFVQIGNRMFAGGTFAEVWEPNHPVIPQPYLFAFDATTGVIDTGFRPVFDKGVYALEAAPDGNLLVGGKFTSVNGQTWKGIVKLDAITGQRITGFAGKLNSGSAVYDLFLRNGHLYTAGAFEKISGVNRSKLASLDPMTGAVDPNLDLPFTGLHNGGTGRINHMDVSPDGNTLVAIGNFTTVAGQPREQIAIVDLSTVPATLSSWQTTRFLMQCASKFETYTTSIDIDPSGTYFVVATAGAYFGGPLAPTLCDSVSRWEIGRTGPNQQPTWASYTGGDSTFAVLSTGPVIYAGGHQRWENNPWRGDAVGPGAVVRTGVAALDPVNGVPLSWNPSRYPRGTGIEVFYATAAGLWWGDDTCCLNGVNRDRIKFLPLAGGTPVPQTQQATLPTDLYQVPVSTCPSVDPSVLFRVNTGGPQLTSLDCGPNWSVDTNTTGQTSPFRNTGSNVSTWSTIPSVTPNVPATTPIDVFSTERWDPAAFPELEWNFPVTAGVPIEVRLYMANSCTCTNDPGERRFDVRLDGTLVLDNYDEVADVGWRVGTMKSFTRLSDGNVDIDFGHRTEMPLINAIEIIRTDIAPIDPGTTSSLSKRTFDGTTPGPLTPVPTPGIDWKQARGAFWANGNLYTGWSDGKFYARPFDGTTLGPAREIGLNGLLSGTPTFFPVSSISGMALDNGLLYVSVTGDPNLYYRGFSLESEIVGAQRFTAASTGGVNWGDVRGMTIAGGKIFFARSNGNLYRIDFVGGAPVTGTEVLLSGPTIDGINWLSNGLFVQVPAA